MIMRYVLLIAGLLLSFFSVQNAIVAQEQATVSQETTTQQTRDNVAVVAWTGYNYRRDFRKKPSFMKEMFCDPNGAFGVKQENYVAVDMDVSFPEGFSAKIKEAVDKIKDKKDPILIIALSAHGGEGVIGQQKNKNIKYEEMVDLLFENSFGIQKDITVMIFIEACYSGSIIPVIQSKLCCDGSQENCLFEGLDGGCYEHKISVFASAPAEKESWGNRFFNTLNFISKRDEYKDKAIGVLNNKGISAFISSKRYWGAGSDDRVFWSSFSGKDEVLTSNGHDSKRSKKIIKNDVETIKDATKDLSLRLAAVKELGYIAMGDQTVIDALLYVVENDIDKNMQDEAALSLARINP